VAVSLAVVWSFLSQYSEVTSCIYAKNLVFELGFGVVGASTASILGVAYRELPRAGTVGSVLWLKAGGKGKVLGKLDVPVRQVHHREGKSPAA